MFGPADKPFPNGSADQLRRQIVEGGAVALGQDFGVTGFAQHIAQLAQFVDDRHVVSEPEGIRRRL